MPLSLASCSISCRVRRTCTSDETALNPTVTRMIPNDGTTSAGAKRKICGIYRSDMRLVRPVDMSVPSSISHRELTAMERFASSPALCLRKKSAGSDMTRIIMDA